MSKIRITAGRYRGRVIMTPGESTHPMAAREKIALFNMINDSIPGVVVLDAYAGSGALGIEALSRGAKKAVFVEKSPKAARVIKDNLKGLGAEGEVITGDISKYSPSDFYKVVIADPPYDNFELGTIERLTRLVDNGGILVLSHPGEAPSLPGLSIIKTRKYAEAHISIYQKSN